LTALLFAELCAEAGLPPGVFNLVPAGGAVGSKLVTHTDVDKVAFTGSNGIGRLLRQLTAGSGKKLSLELGGKSPVVVFASADLDSAVEGVVNAIYLNQVGVITLGFVNHGLSCLNYLTLTFVFLSFFVPCITGSDLLCRQPPARRGECEAALHQQTESAIANIPPRPLTREEC
jgi:hypothetical protein